MYGRDSLGLKRIRRETKKLENSNEWILRKMQKPPFMGMSGHKGQIWTVLGQNGQNWIFSKERLEHFYRVYEF